MFFAFYTIAVIAQLQDGDNRMCWSAIARRPTITSINQQAQRHSIFQRYPVNTRGQFGNVDVSSFAPQYNHAHYIRYLERRFVVPAQNRYLVCCGIGLELVGDFTDGF